jgi:hypothetical protein
MSTYLTVKAEAIACVKRIIGKNGGPRRRRGTRVADPRPPPEKVYLFT